MERLCESSWKRSNNVSDSSRRQKSFASLIILDLEATGLKRRPRITELCMLAVLTDEIKSSNKPRVVNKLQLCFNPESAIDSEASRLTGLYNDVLEQMATFRDQAHLISSFLTCLPQPVCFIAHNGHGFDFPLLQSEFCKANCCLPAETEIYCADSLQAFRVLDGLPAIPEWLVRKEAEEKQKEAVSPGEPESTSSNKRQVNCIDNSAEDTVLVCKLPKMDTIPSFSSESSVTDTQLVEAYEAAVMQAGSTDVSDSVSPVHEPADSTVQYQQETTPTKNTILTPDTAPVPVKKRPPVSVNLADRQRVTRKLFEECDMTNISYQKKRSGCDNVKKAAPQFANQLSSQGSLSNEELLHMVHHTESEVTSLLPFQLGAGECLLPSRQDKDDGAQKNKAVTENISSIKNRSHKSNEVSQSEANLTSDSSAPSRVSNVSSSSSSPSPPSSQMNTRLSPSPTPKVSYKQVEIYRRHFGCYPHAAHTAEDDCHSLLRLVMNQASYFMSFVEDHAVSFDTVKPMF